MAELPEIEVLRRDLEREVVGKKVKEVTVHTVKAVRRHRTRKGFAAVLEGRKITAVSRRGRHLLLRLDAGDALVVDLGPTGQLVRAKSARAALAKHTAVVVTFTQGGQLRFVDGKGGGEMFVAPLESLDELEEFRDPGLDPLETAISWDLFGRQVAQRRAKLKVLLMDPHILVGIGPVYSDEILFAAGLRWDRESDSLSDQEVRRLYRAIVETVQEAVKHRGASIDGNGYTDLFGEPGDYQHHLCVYERDGEACPRCRHAVVKARSSNRSIYFCEACQV